MSSFLQRANVLLFLVLVVARCQAVTALDIDLNYVSPFDDPNSESPDFDEVLPGNQPPAGLRSLMEYAEGYYEDIFADFHNLQINYWYEDLSGGDLGFNSIVDTDIPGDPARRVIEANVRIDTRVGTGGAYRDYFIDASPTSDFEFDMQQTLWRDLNSTERNNWFNDFGTDIPDTFEVGYRGDAVGSGAVGNFDMLSIVLHEIGHSLGVIELNPIALADDDYDFNSDFVFGESLAAENASGDDWHLGDPEALMNPSIGAGVRERPSHTDLFAFASGNDYFLLDVPRREFYGGTSWNQAGNWSGDTTPDDDDDAYVRNGASATLGANGSAGNLFVQEDAVVSTGANLLAVADKLTIEGADVGSQANVVVNSGGRVTAHEIELNDGGLLTVTAGVTEEVDANVIDINPGGVLLGNGDVRINSILRNDGAISAIAGVGDELSLLTGPVDLDGISGDGQVFAVLGNLRISASLADDFNGEMTIGAGRQIQKFGSWQFGNISNGGQLNLQGGDNSNPATLETPTGSLTFGGGTIEVTGHAHIEGTTFFEDGATVQVQAGSRLTLNGSSTFHGGTYQGDGEMLLVGNANVDEATTMNVRIVDLDGIGFGGTLTNINAPLTLNVDQINSGGPLFNIFSGTLNLNGSDASLIVNLNSLPAWQLAGTLNANGVFGSPQDTLRGSRVVVAGIINADRNVQFSAPLDVYGTIALADTSTEVWLAEAIHIIRNSATITGDGQLVVADAGTVQAQDGATIDTDVFSLGRFEPGLPIGTVRINADYTQQATGILGIEIGGAPGSDNDFLQVTDVASLAGELEVTVVAGAMPSIGPNYTLLTADSVVGTFDTFTLHSEESIFHYEATLSYPGTRVVLEFTDVSMFGDFDDDLTLDCADIDALVAEISSGGMDLEFDLDGDLVVDLDDLDLWLQEAGEFNVGGPYLLGDANLDGFVDGQDFVVWNGNKFTATPEWCGGDFNADGVVDGQDFIIWNTFKFMASDAAVTPVPEPGVTSLLLFMAVLFVGQTRRSRIQSVSGVKSQSVSASKTTIACGY